MKYTIITVCYNAEETIDATIKSVLEQTYENIEYIVIDGLSSDNTKSIIENYKDQISIYISEKDKGIYDAMNKAIKLSSGDILYFLNSGDTFLQTNTIEYVAKQMKLKPKSGIYLAKGIGINPATGYAETIDFYSRISPFFLYYNSVCQQCFFTTRDVFDKHGLFDTSYKTKADNAWFINCVFKKNVKFLELDTVVFYYDLAGLSTTQYEKYGKKESQRIKRDYFSSFQKNIFHRRFLFITRHIFK